MNIILLGGVKEKSSMSITFKKHTSWPPKGWPQFTHITSKSRQALTKDLRTSRIYGLSYEIESTRLYAADTKLYTHNIGITAWEYTIHNDSYEYPVLSFKMIDRQGRETGYEDYVSHIRAFARPLETTAHTARRSVLAGLFLIKQINNGIVPDAQRVLKVYRLSQNEERIFPIQKNIKALQDKI